jgi:hypothetical protein
MAETGIKVGDLLSRIRELVRGAVLPVALYVVAVTVALSLIDRSLGDTSGAFSLGSLISFVAEFFLLREMLRAAGLRREGEGGGFGSYFGVSFLSGLGTILALLLLIVPGIIVWTRWLPAVTMVLVEDAGPSEALSKSWEATRGHFWPLFATALIGIAALLAMAVGFGAVEALVGPAAEIGPASLAEVLWTNAVGTAFGVYTSALGIAAYVELTGRDASPSETFA